MKQKFLFSIIASIFILQSCEKDINIDFPIAPSPYVIEGYIENGQGPFVTVSRGISFINEISNDDFLNLLRKNISDVYGHLRTSFNVEKAFDFSSILLQFSQMAAGEQIILQLCLIKTLREYIGISGAVILDGWPLSILDIAYRHLAIEILSSISDQVIIFEGNWWSDFPKQFDLTNLNLIQLHVKRPPAFT